MALKVKTRTVMGAECCQDGLPALVIAACLGAAQCPRRLTARSQPGTRSNFKIPSTVSTESVSHVHHQKAEKIMSRGLPVHSGNSHDSQWLSLIKSQ